MQEIPGKSRRVSCAPRHGSWPGQRDCDAPAVLGEDGYDGGGDGGLPGAEADGEALDDEEDEPAAEEEEDPAAAGAADADETLAWSLRHGPWPEGDPAADAAAAAADEAAAEKTAAWQAAERVCDAANDAYEARPSKDCSPSGLLLAYLRLFSLQFLTLNRRDLLFFSHHRRSCPPCRRCCTACGRRSG